MAKRSCEAFSYILYYGVMEKSGALTVGTPSGSTLASTT